MTSQPFDDVSIKQAAQQLGKHPRTLMRWTREPNGLPFIRLGQAPYIHLPTLAVWLKGRIQRPNPPRRGRR